MLLTIAEMFYLTVAEICIDEDESNGSKTTDDEKQKEEL